MLLLVFKTLWILLPGGMANMAPIFAAKLFPRFDAPVDFGKSFRGKRIFGDHKTIRGIISGVVVGEVTFQIQQALARTLPALAKLSFGDSNDSSFMFWGALLGLGALTGDLVKSFFKRRVGVEPGKAWFPWDQVDWILGTLAVSALLIPLSLRIVVISILLGLGLHLLVKWIGFTIGINQTRI